MAYSNYLPQYPSGLYVFMLKAPLELQPVLYRTDARRSLKTHDKLKAQVRSIRLMIVCKKLFSQLRKGKRIFMTPDEMNKQLDIWAQKSLMMMNMTE